jgi:hypothetical protein
VDADRSLYVADSKRIKVDKLAAVGDPVDRRGAGKGPIEVRLSSVAPLIGVERLEADIRDAAAVLTFLDLKLLETSIQEGFWIEIFDAAAAKVQQVDNQIADRVTSVGSGSVAKCIDCGLRPISSVFVDVGIVI